jgi:hypothetical protein
MQYFFQPLKYDHWRLGIVARSEQNPFLPRRRKTRFGRLNQELTRSQVVERKASPAVCQFQTVSRRWTVHADQSAYDDPAGGILNDPRDCAAAVPSRNAQHWE